MNHAIGAGYEHTCALTDAGGVTCWGSNAEGQLGNGSSADTHAPGVVDVSGLERGVSAIAAGGFHSCALTSAGGVKCWGSNEYGQLGDATTTSSAVPVDVAALASGVAEISVGWAHTCASMTTGGVKCWGHNAFGGLGDGTRTDSSTPVAVSGLSSGVTAIAAGGLHTCALMSDDRVLCWGDGQSDDPDVGFSLIPVDAKGPAGGFAAIVAGGDRTCGLTSDGRVLCSGPDAATPGDSVADRWVGRDVSSLGGAAAISMGEQGLCAITNAGGVACWDGSETAVQVPGLASGVRGIAVGGRHACALDGDGAGACWGSNVQGQLGVAMRCSSTSIPVDLFLDGSPAPTPASNEPGSPPAGPLDHATGATDVVLRFDRGPDVAVGDLVGELFQPGPEFTLYGDGTVIYRNDRAPRPPSVDGITRGRPFRIAHLAEDQIQSLLRFALDAGGLWDACERYEAVDTDVSSSDVFTIRAGGLDKRVQDLAGSFEPLTTHLRRFARSGIPTTTWTPDSYWGNLLDSSIFAFIGDGVVPGLVDDDIAPWPWPGVAPADFAGLAELQSGRRVMSADEAAALGLSDKGGVVQRVYLRGPDGKAIYYFSLWPRSLDEGGP
jgi:alpha-tubulin suppressor-like RCC1 family protein